MSHHTTPQLVQTSISARIRLQTRETRLVPGKSLQLFSSKGVARVSQQS